MQTPLQFTLDADFSRVHALLEQGVTPFFEWLASMRDQEPETVVLGHSPYTNLVALYLSAMLKRETMVVLGGVEGKDAPRYVIEYFHDTSRQVIPLPRPFEYILDVCSLHFSPQPGGRATGHQICDVADWLGSRRDMQDLQLFSSEGYCGVRVRQRPGLVRHYWFVEFFALDGEWTLYTLRRRHGCEVARQYKRAIWALKFARAEVEKRRTTEEEPDVAPVPYSTGV
jgi:hypothetical protein